MLHRFRETLLRPGVDLRSTPAGLLERWLGAAAVEKLSRDMRGWPGPPIPVHGVPGAVFATGDGDFIGRILAGSEVSALDRANTLMRRLARMESFRRAALTRQFGGFSSFSDLINKATTAAGQRYEYQFSKVGPTGVANVTSTLWRVGNQPAAGAAGSAAPGGRATTSATAGAHPFTNPASGTQHVIAANIMASVAGNSLLLYDRIFDVAKTMSSSATEAVTGVPTRYQSQTASAADYIGGNFLFIEIFAALGATGHNWTTCTYTDQAGAASTLPSLTGNNAGIIDRLDHPVNQWYAPYETGDVGIGALTQMQCSAVVTGSINFVIGHPICWAGFPIANLITAFDYVQTAFNLTRIFDNACLSLLEANKPTTGATTYNGQFSGLAG